MTSIDGQNVADIPKQKPRTKRNATQSATALESHGWKASGTDADGATKYTHLRLGDARPEPL